MCTCVRAWERERDIEGEKERARRRGVAGCMYTCVNICMYVYYEPLKFVT